ncbi:prefoldin subunit beta [Methanobrevibacter wolinii]|uniref:prefoldin subunit beta n=1 Tax=Methanobrevibacter wolinii TaxID=190977 RepID=UPI0005B288F8|nr:prefoldin subunit beta [Methanobrevibacter wolinii]MDD5959266.1 prefoldin subunit beta [Methanobrevibacter wolinii]
MDIPQNVQEQLNQFQNLQQQAQAVALQKQNLDIQVNEAERALAELEKTDSDTEVFKSAGSLLIKADRDEVYEETKENLETLKIRQKTMDRQEERVMKKLQEMQTSIQSAMKGLGVN